MPLVQCLKPKDLLAHAGIDIEKALGVAARPGVSVWSVATPVASADALIESSKFYRSVVANVDDADKRSQFGTMVAALIRAGTVQDYASVLNGFGVTCKPAHSFKARGSTWRVMELRHNNKDRLYYYPVTTPERRLFVLLLAEHKKDQNTPKHVCAYTESVVRQLTDPQDPLIIV